MIDPRLEQILALRKEGKTQPEIGKVFGITYQRVQQLVRQLPAEDRKLFGFMKKRTTVTCERCGKVSEVQMSYARRKYCNNACKRLYATRGEYRLAHNARHLKRYYTNLVFREKHKKAMQDRWKKVRADPVAYAKLEARQKIHQKKYLDKKRREREGL